MANETQMWEDDVRPILKAAGLDPHRIENRVGVGFPDVNYSRGWIELKDADDWPKRPATDLKLRHFTKQQRVWLKRRWVHSEACFLLLRVRREFLLFDGDKASDYVGRSTRDVLYHKMRAHSQAGFEPVVFLPVLRMFGPSKSLSPLKHER